MRKTLLVLCVLFASSVFSQEYPDQPGQSEMIDPERELATLGSFDGVCEGFLEVNYDPVGVYRDNRAGFDIRITIRGNSVEVQTYDDDKKLIPLAVENYIYGVEATAMINTVNRKNGFVENFSIFLAHVNEDRMEGYVSRVAHNYLVRETSPWRVIPVYARLIMDRVR